MFEIIIEDVFLFDLNKKDEKSIIIYGSYTGDSQINDILSVKNGSIKNYKIISFPMINRTPYNPSNIFIEIEPEGNETKEDMIKYLKNRRLVK